ncbi:MAG TPA: BON domain-containing protein [Vicinamibacterales bacterium]
MNILTSLSLATLVVVSVAGAACTQEAADTATNEVGVVVDDTQEAANTATNEVGVVVDDTQDAAEKTADASKNIAEKTVDKTKEIASATARTATAAVSATGEAVTDGWITTRIHSKFVDESLLKGSDIDVDTQDHVVTLKGTVTSDAAKGRAVAVARSTEGVNQVVNRLVVGSK